MHTSQYSSPTPCYSAVTVPGQIHSHVYERSTDMSKGFTCFVVVVVVVVVVVLCVCVCV